MPLRNFLMGLLIISYFTPWGIFDIPYLPYSTSTLASKNNEEASHYLSEAKKSYDRKDTEALIHYTSLYQSVISRNNAFLTGVVIEKLNFTVIILGIYLIIKYEEKSKTK